MEFSCRSLLRINRLFRVPRSFALSRNITGMAVKEESNPEVLNSLNSDIKSGETVPVFRRALLWPSRVALQDEFGIYTYAGLHQAASVLSKEISAQLLGDTERTIGYMCSNDASHVIVQWAIWMTGNIAVPLTPLHPPEMLKYFLIDSGASLVICTQDFEKLLRPIALDLGKPLLVNSRDKEITAQLYQPNSTFLTQKAEESLSDIGRSNSWYGKNDALIIYTSGTTSKPKGVVWTHNMLATQIASLHAAWKYSCNDVVLHTLPLHHIHGQLNSLNASLAAGAKIRMLSSFVSPKVWARLLGMGERDETKVTVFHGVPAMYGKLLADYEKIFRDQRTADYVRQTLGTRMRLMCAGSAPLPESVFNKWEEISGCRLLERYGMTEVGMALSNPYFPKEGRSVGCVGQPLPGVTACIAAVESDVIIPLITVETPVADRQISPARLGLATEDNFGGTDAFDWHQPVVKVHRENKDGVFEGELLLRGPGIFTRYWNRAPKLNSADFTEDGWFRTGDTASYSEGTFKILGRTSVDIIKYSGYKISALQVESAILEHPNVEDAAVLGVTNEVYGEIISAVVVLRDKTKVLTLKDLNNEVGKKLAPYQLPRILSVVESMPRNAMGKLDKKEIRRLFGDKLVLKK